MKSALACLISIIISISFAWTPATVSLLAAEPAPTDSVLSQPLIREGDLAIDLAEALKLGAPSSETEAEDLLSAAEIAPHNGWIADYPLTPDIVGELQSGIAKAADSGKLSLDKAAALKAFKDLLAGYDMPIKPGTAGENAGEASAPAYSGAGVPSDYYQEEGPPVVTYYSPPPDYAYMYTWVPYPFWWSDLWFPGFFILVDFNVRTHHHHHGHDHTRGRSEIVTNHFRDPRTGKNVRINPGHRVQGNISPQRPGPGFTNPQAQRGAQSILNRSLEFRGHGISQNPAGVRSSVFEHSVNRGNEHAASDRGFQSRMGAGQIPAAPPRPSGVPGGISARPSAPAGGAQGFHGGFHGGLHR